MWTCVTDLSCIPEAGPLEDASSGEIVDAAELDAASVEDASLDASAD